MSKKSYEIITLGCNCEPRGYLTAWNLIPTKTKGRLSLPFDLSVHNIDIVNQLIKNNFSTYLDKLRYGYRSGNRYYWTNFDDEVIYYHDFHDKPHYHKKMIKRYSQRIKNFQKMSTSEHFVFFLINLDANSATANDLNELYENLKNYRQGQEFALLAWDQYNLINHEELNREIKIVSHRTPESNSLNAWDVTRKKDSKLLEHDKILKEFVINSIKEHGFEIKYYKLAMQDKIKYFLKYNLPKLFAITNNWIDNRKTLILFGKKINLWKLPED